MVRSLSLIFRFTSGRVLPKHEQTSVSKQSVSKIVCNSEQNSHFSRQFPTNLIIFITIRQNLDDQTAVCEIDETRERKRDERQETITPPWKKSVASAHGQFLCPRWAHVWVRWWRLRVQASSTHVTISSWYGHVRGTHDGDMQVWVISGRVIFPYHAPHVTAAPCRNESLAA